MEEREQKIRSLEAQVLDQQAADVATILPPHLHVSHLLTPLTPLVLDPPHPSHPFPFLRLHIVHIGNVCEMMA